MKSILNGRKGFENKKLNEKVCENEKRLKNERSNLIRIRSKQIYILNKFERSKKVEEMVKQLGISKSTIKFKINLYELIRKSRRIENTSLC